MRAALEVEWLKLHRSVLVRVTTALLVVGAPALAAGLLLASAAAPPDSPLAAKTAALVVGTGWPALLGLVAQVLAVAVLLGAGMVVAWCFGREFTDRTVTSLFALPVPRATTASAKLLVISGWGLGVAVSAPAVTVLAGLLTGLGAPDAGVVAPVLRAVGVALLSVLLAVPLALAASAGRGHLPAVGVLLLVVVLTQVVTALGAGAWFPYAAPGLWSGAGGAAAADEVTAGQLAVVPLVALAGHAATVAWWRRAEVV